ncbi:type II toxin-antitoxin system RelE/ParE family toxin [Brevundimonas sp.]|uniref:type II toxin-antitoxin system RelE/ParE family toxin n=1 Tax=Brevundimonas sp. TaxID=1871086 RepID=UPI003A95AD25
MIEIEQTDEFRDWLAALRDLRARARIAARIDRLRFGNPGVVEPVGDGVSEIKIDYGPGYRLYYKSKGKTIVIMLCGGDKSRQQTDIKKAKNLASKL